MLTGSALIAAACTFPSVTFLEDRLGEPEGGSEGGADSPVDVAIEKVANPDVDPDGGSTDASKLGDATAVIDAAGCKTCDCDEDGYDRVDPDAGCSGGPTPDCDDTVAAINPGQRFFILDPWPKGAKHPVVGDWDCSGQTTRQFEYNAQCKLLAVCSGGFTGNPACGESAPFLTCQELVLPLLGLTCTEKSTAPAGTVPQGCH